jgi:aminoglycoside/choline kinase family phosphotransferase
MKEREILANGFKEIFGHKPDDIVPLPQSGSDRKYFRLTDGSKSIIGAYNANYEENEAFIGFTYHFISKGLPVPEIFGYFPEKYIYFLSDLGNINLFTFLLEKKTTTGFDSESELLYRKVLDRLVQFQITGIRGLNLDLCYPYKSFDRQSMVWDMNYFKYMFLKLISVPFNELKLEQDFNALAGFLLEAGQDYFLYRDFQSANIMLVGEEPWFIDYQGGRKGAPQYDAASLLYDAKAHIPEEKRESLLDYYIKNFCAESGEEEDTFRRYFAGYSIIRLMQALGAFGFRGLYEKKPTFTGSIVPAVELLIQLTASKKVPLSLPELANILVSIQELKIYKELDNN